MAILRSLADRVADRVDKPLPARLLIGRSASCGFRIDEPHASSEHARITWTGNHWELRDLGSRNGTYLNGTKLEPGIAAKLVVGTRVAFGNPQEVWEVIDDEAPSMLAIEMNSGELMAAKDGLLVLPSEDNPVVSLYQHLVEGWIAEDDDGNIRPIKDQEIVLVDGRSWRVELPFVSDGTPLMQLDMGLESIELQFAVSRDEERVEITIYHRGVELKLEPREHGYVLLTLARARKEDEALSPSDRGWRDRNQLERMLAMDSNALNVAIHRARQQFLAAGVSGAAGIVEVRRKKRRLGLDRFRIVSLPS